MNERIPVRTGITTRHPARASFRVLHRAARQAAVLITAAIIGCAADTDPDAADVEVREDVTDSLPQDMADSPLRDPVSAPADAPGDEQVPEPDGVMGAAWTGAETNVERPMAGAALLRDLRTAEHTGFDRIVLDFGPDNVPGYRVAYIDRPIRQCGSGHVVPLAGDGWLSITVQPANAHTEEGEPTVRERERMPRLPTVLELKLICDFEAMVEIVAGVSSPERYRVFELAAPGRLVIDVMHGGTER